MGTHFN
jgi:hypothetical protein